MQFRPPICSSIWPNKFFLNHVVKQCHSEVWDFTKEADRSLKEPKYFTEMKLYVKNMSSSNTQQKRFWAMRGNTSSLISVQQRTQLLSLMEPAKWIFLNCWVFNNIQMPWSTLNQKCCYIKWYPKPYISFIPHTNFAENFGEKWTSYKNARR